MYVCVCRTANWSDRRLPRDHSNIGHFPQEDQEQPMCCSSTITKLNVLEIVSRANCGWGCYLLAAYTIRISLMVDASCRR